MITFSTACPRLYLDCSTANIFGQNMASSPGTVADYSTRGLGSAFVGSARLVELSLENTCEGGDGEVGK